MIRLTETRAWSALWAHLESVRQLPMRDLFAADPNRFEHLSLRFDDWLLDFSKNRVTPETLDLLRALAEHEGIVLTREQLLERVWGYDYYGETRTVDVHITQVRRKLGDRGVRIQTVRGVGYKLVTTPPE